MTIAASGPLRSGAILTEYGGTTPMRLGDYRRGHASLRVRKNAANNLAVNHSAAVGETVLRMGQFLGQGKGWTYTNTTNRIRSGGSHYYPQNEFGTDWSNGNDWPMFYINNAVIGATDTSTLAVVMQGRTSGHFTFTNNNEIQGAGGQPNSGAGQHAFYIQATNATFKPRVINNYAIRGGGGAGGIGGTGGTGGQGYYVATGQEGPLQEPAVYSFNNRNPNPATTVFWAGGNLAGTWGIPGSLSSWASGGYTYYRYTQTQSTTVNGITFTYHHIYRQWPYNVYTSGGGGGGGGNGGRGIGYNAANLNGNGGAGGAPGGTNAGAGGTGGTGGTGGSWGAYGNTGNTGAGGGYGNYTGWGSGGAAGGGGGAGGYSIYAEASTPWSLTNTNTLNGSYGGGTNPS